MGSYQVVDRACADGVDEVDEELNHEDNDKEGRHDQGRLMAGYGHRALEVGSGKPCLGLYFYTLFSSILFDFGGSAYDASWREPTNLIPQPFGLSLLALSS